MARNIRQRRSSKYGANHLKKYIKLEVCISTKFSLNLHGYTSLYCAILILFVYLNIFHYKTFSPRAKLIEGDHVPNIDIKYSGGSAYLHKTIK